MAKLGFEAEEMAKYQEALLQPYGMVLHTGPTGSGKTTTLYSALTFLNDPKKNLMTIEDPVEYNLAGIIQCQVINESGLTFANILRTALRQDPNIMMLGEIRDNETANIAVKAALTGHLMLSTVHTNDAPSTVMRLVDMGVDRVDVGSAVLIVVAQRLVKKICPQCIGPIQINREDLDRIQVNPKEIEGLELYKGAGCSNCNGSGYRGRQALYEIMRITPVIREAIFKGADLNELTEVAIAEGMNTLRMLAIKKWKRGETTIEEILRVTASE
jgi:type IV pilus assembly protein PilB